MAILFLAATLPLASLYAWLVFHLPGILNVFVCFAFAFVLGSFAKRVCVTAKVRNPRWIGRYGLLLGLCGWYVQWTASALLQRDTDAGVVALFSGALQLLVEPSAVVAFAGRAMQSATSSFMGLPERYLLVVCWLGELWMLPFFPYYIGKMRAEEVFDETAGKWAEYTELPNRFRPIDQPGLLRLLDSPSERLSTLLHPHSGPATANHTKLRVYGSGCGDALVSLVSVDLDSKGGQPRTIECSPGLYLYVPAAELDALRAGQADPAAEGADPPELADAIGHMQAGRSQAAYEAAHCFVDAADTQLYCDANRICAIACSQAGDWRNALAYWEALFAREASAHNALQVATSAIMAGEAGQAQEWIKRTDTLNASTQEMPSVTILTTIISALTAANQLEPALLYLGQLRDFYTSLRVTDPTFLFAHRMPLFHMFLEKSGAVVRQVLDRDASRAWYTSMLPHLDERGQSELKAWLEESSAPV